MEQAQVRLSNHIKTSMYKSYVLPVATRCNARCTFCATIQYHPRVQREMMQIDGLDRTLAALTRAGVTRFEVTGGGEPTLHPKLYEILSKLRDSGGRFIKLYTNALRLRPGLEIDQLNISRASFDEHRNQAIMRMVSGSPNLRDVVEQARAWGYENIRLSVPMVRGGVDSLSSAAEFLSEVTRVGGWSGLPPFVSGDASS